MDMDREEGVATGVSDSASPAGNFDGVVIGILIGFKEDRTPLVAFPGNPRMAAISAKTTATLTSADIGRDVALLFEGADPGRPFVIGRIQKAQYQQADRSPSRARAEIDGESLILNAEREIVLRCGKASITLTRAGKVIVRGTYLLSRSSGVNRIKGGSVQIN
jgi:hypothetical protein